MRRLAILVVALALVGGVLAWISADRAPGHGSGYTIDAIFDDTSGLIPENNVMIAGAKVGTVSRLSLTGSDQARVQMRISSRYAPFYADARCQIRPVALIGEMEVDCDPGRASAGRLRATRRQPPTVPIAMTTVPVDLTDLFDIWSAPVSQRASIVLWTLGAGLAGRGTNLNAVLERSNPTLALARQTITTLDEQRMQLGSMIESSDRLLATLAPHRAAAQAFVGRAAAVATVTAAHRGVLEQSVQRLPGLLAAARPALAQLQLVAQDATPIVSRLRSASPNLNQMVAEIVPVAGVALPAISRIGSLAQTGLRVLPSLTPLATRLGSFAHAGLPVARLLSVLFTSMQQRGFVEGLNDFPYYVGSSLSRYDATSHLSASNFLTSACGGSDESSYAACSARYGAAVASSASPRRRSSRQTLPARAGRSRAQPGASAHAGAPVSTTAPTPAPSVTGIVSRSPSAAVHAVQNLLDYLLK